MDEKLFEEEVVKATKHYALLKDEILNGVVWDTFLLYDMSEADAGVLVACLNILASKQTAQRLRGGFR